MPVVGPVFIEGAQLRQELLRVERGGGGVVGVGVGGGGGGGGEKD